MIKKAKHLEKWSRFAMQSVICFLWAKMSTYEIHSQILEVYGTEAISRQHCEQNGITGRKDVENCSKRASSCPSSSVTEISVVRVEEIIQSYRLVTVYLITSELLYCAAYYF